MRKYRRAIYRAYAESKGLKTSEFVHNSWHRFQVKKIGASLRAAHVRHGTKPRRKWRAA